MEVLQLLEILQIRGKTLFNLIDHSKEKLPALFLVTFSSFESLTSGKRCPWMNFKQSFLKMIPKSTSIKGKLLPLFFYSLFKTFMHLRLSYAFAAD